MDLSSIEAKAVLFIIIGLGALIYSLLVQQKITVRVHNLKNELARFALVLLLFYCMIIVGDFLSNDYSWERMIPSTIGFLISYTILSAILISKRKKEISVSVNGLNKESFRNALRYAAAQVDSQYENRINSVYLPETDLKLVCPHSKIFHVGKISIPIQNDNRVTLQNILEQVSEHLLMFVNTNDIVPSKRGQLISIFFSLLCILFGLFQWFSA